MGLRPRRQAGSPIGGGARLLAQRLRLRAAIRRHVLPATGHPGGAAAAVSRAFAAWPALGLDGCSWLSPVAAPGWPGGTPAGDRPEQGRLERLAPRHPGGDVCARSPPVGRAAVRFARLRQGTGFRWGPEPTLIRPGPDGERVRRLVGGGRRTVAGALASGAVPGGADPGGAAPPVGRPPVERSPCRAAAPMAARSGQVLGLGLAHRIPSNAAAGFRSAGCGWREGPPVGCPEARGRPLPGRGRAPDSGPRTPDPGLWTPDSGPWTLDSTSAPPSETPTGRPARRCASPWACRRRGRHGSPPGSGWARRRDARAGARRRT